MNLIKLIDKQSNKLVSKSKAGMTIQNVMPLNNAPEINNIEQFANTARELKKMGYGVESLVPIINPSLIPDIYKSEFASDAYAANLGGIKNSYSSLENYQKYLNDRDTLNLATQAQNDYRGMQIANGVFGGISSLTNMGLGIWNAVEQSQNNAKLRDVYDKQMALAQEQIDASKELRKQRQEEIARLKRVRSNTNQRFNSSAIVSRSY